MAGIQRIKVRRLLCGRGPRDIVRRGFRFPRRSTTGPVASRGGRFGGSPRAPRGLARVVVRARAVVADAGMATAEYAVGTLAACGFAALLFAILRGSEMKSMLLGIMKRALSV